MHFSRNIIDTEESSNDWIKVESIKDYSLLPVTSAILEEYSGEESSDEYWKVLTSDNLEL